MNRCDSFLVDDRIESLYSETMSGLSGLDKGYVARVLQLTVRPKSKHVQLGFRIERLKDCGVKDDDMPFAELATSRNVTLVTDDQPLCVAMKRCGQKVLSVEQALEEVRRPNRN